MKDAMKTTRYLMHLPQPVDRESTIAQVIPRAGSLHSIHTHTIPPPPRNGKRRVNLFLLFYQFTWNNKLLFVPPSGICSVPILLLNISMQAQSASLSLQTSLIDVFSLPGSPQFSTEDLYGPSELRGFISHSAAQGAESSWQWHMAAAFLFTLHLLLLIMALRFCWFETRRRNSSSIKEDVSLL